MRKRNASLPAGAGLMALAVTLYFTGLAPSILVLALLAVGFVLFTRGGLAYLKRLENEAKQVTEAASETAGSDADATDTERKLADLEALRDAGLLSREEYRFAVKRLRGGDTEGGTR